MKQAQIEAILLALVKKFLAELNKGHAVQAVTLSSDLDKELGIDSLGRVELFHRIEKEFGIYLPSDLLVEANTLNDIVVAIQAAKPSLDSIKQEYTAALSATTFDPSNVATLTEVLIQRAAYEPNRPHIYLHDDKGVETIITYGQLYAKALKVAMGLANLGVKPNETVAIMLPTCAEFFYAFCGTLLIGAIPVPIYPPYRADRIEEYAMRESTILKTAQVRVLITFEKAELLSKVLKVFIPSLNKVTVVEDLMQDEIPLEPYNANTEDGALIQFTSGSTSAPRGVYLQHANLLANIREYGKSIKVQPNDAGVSWLPLYHDMGLIGAWLAMMYYAIPVTIMSPLTFLSRPESWLWTIHYHRATFSAAPNFGYELCVNKIDEAVIAGLDLSSWRLAFNGAEAINPKTLERFTKKFAPYGFRSETFFPVYGLAENTVALLFPPPGRAPRIDKIAAEPFQQKQQAIPQEGAKHILEFVSCGTPLPEHEVRLVDDNIKPVPERVIGRLQFRGPSAMSGYFQNPEATAAIYFDGWWDSGDLAYQADGEYYITGRRKDIIIKAGRNYYPEEIEEVTAQVNGIRQGCVVAFGVPDAKMGTENLIIVAETKTTDKNNEVVAAIIEKVSVVTGVPPDQVILVPPHTIPKTSSGKLQRSACRADYMQNKLGARRVPASLQLSLLFIKSVMLQLGSWVNKILKAIYTLYVAALIIIPIPLMLLCIFFLPFKSRSMVVHYWAKILLFFAAIRITVKGKDNLQNISGAVVYVANHCSYVDSIILLSILPPGSIFVAKKEMLAVPILASIIKKLHYLTVNRYDISSDIASSELIIKTLQNNQSIIMYPEGTFTYATGLRAFKLGAFKVAAETSSPICPIAMQGTRQILRDGSYLLAPGPVIITIGNPVISHSNAWQEITRLHTEVRDFIAKNCGEPSIVN